MFLLESTNVPIGAKAVEFDLPGIDGKNHTLDDFKEAKGLVIIFMCNHCPYVQAVIHRLIDLNAQYKDKGIQFIGINANESDNYAEDSFEKMPEYAKEWGMDFTYLRDEDQKVARAYNAQCTPDIYLYDQDQKLYYHGRIDDNWKEPESVKTHELKDAIDTLLSGKSYEEEQHPSIGCSIKWK